MPRRRQGYKLNYVLLAILAKRGPVPTRVLRRLFGRGVYAYIRRLRESGVADSRGGAVALSEAFKNLINLYLRKIDEEEREISQLEK
mgnify:CR=1 FL=1